jgi:predicted nucleotidyltransferase
VSEINRQAEMIALVARALGTDLLARVVFVGGCSTGFLVTDALTKEDIRYTDDVDLIVSIASYVEWNKLQEQLRLIGFKDDTSADAPICRMRLGELKVDFMPDSDILGFSNSWYREALETASDYNLADSLQIKLVDPVYFIATKLEAFKGRGKGDILSSHDLEDIVNLFDGRDTIAQEVITAKEDVREYIIRELAALDSETDFQYLVQSATRSDTQREEAIYARLDAILGRRE